MLTHNLVKCRMMTEASRVFDVLEDVFENVFSNMHYVQKNLRYWKAKAEVVTRLTACFVINNVFGNVL